MALPRLDRACVSQSSKMDLHWVKKVVFIGFAPSFMMVFHKSAKPKGLGFCLLRVKGPSDLARSQNNAKRQTDHPVPLPSRFRPLPPVGPL